MIGINARNDEMLGADSHPNDRVAQVWEMVAPNGVQLMIVSSVDEHDVFEFDGEGKIGDFFGV